MSKSVAANLAPVMKLQDPEKFPIGKRWATRMQMLGSVPLVEALRLGSEALSGQFPRDPNRPMVINPKGYRHPITVHANVADLSTVWEIVPQQEYSLPRELDRFINGLPIIDIGANIGLASAYFATRYPKSVVVGIEPHPRNFELLEQNAKPYDLHLVPVQRAFSLSEGQVPLLNPEDYKKSLHTRYMFRDEPVNGIPDISAPSISPEEIADMVSRSPHSSIGLLKIDIEGGEALIFNSPRIDELLRITKVLAIETHDKYVPGCSESVTTATERNGMSRFGGSPRSTTTFFGSPYTLSLLHHH